MPNKKFRLPLTHLRLARKVSVALLFLLQLHFGTTAFGQTVSVNGKVLNDKGAPVEGASIVQKGTSNGTVSDKNGAFTLQVPANAVLEITGIGFGKKEVKVTGGGAINIEMTSVDNSLGEVVVVGYGTQRKKDVTGAVASVSEKTLKEVPAPNLVAQLKGRAAGVSIVQNGSTPGSAGQIRIRGNRTITNSQGASDALDGPLLVLDGIPYGGSINDINPDDISNIEILKDASATAIYGSRGAGGVLLITTKRGRTGKAVISFDSYVGFAETLDKYTVFSGQEYAQFKSDAATYNRTSPGTTSYPLTTAEQDALSKGISTDWQDLIYQKGFITNQQLSVTGGSETTQFGLGAGFYSEGGIIPNQNFDRFSLRATIDHRINKRLKIGLNTLNTLSYSNTPGGGGVPSGMVRLTPLAPPYIYDSTLNQYTEINLNPAIGSIDALAVSPLTLETKSDAIYANNRRIRTFNSLYGEVQIATGLKYRLNVGLDFRQENGNGYNGPLTYTNTATVQSSSNAALSNAEAWSYNIQNLLFYDKVFNEKHKLGFTGLFEVTKDHSQSSRFTVTGVPDDYILNSNFALASGQPVADGANSNYSELGLLSYMARVNYGYDNRYLVTATVRVDGSSTLSPGNQYFTYPAIGLGWNILEEEFAQGINFLSALKLRGGWGISGNRNVSPYATFGLLGTSTYNFGTSTAGQQLAYLVTSLPNPNLGWQSTKQWDIGLDFAMFNRRIMGSIDVYKQTTEDILLNVNLPLSNGANSTLKNVGATEGKGLEVSISTLNIEPKTKGGFSWSTDWVFSMNREKITQLTQPGELSNIGNGWFVGEPLTVIYDYKKLGIWQTEDSVKGTLASQTSPRQYPGQIRVEDVNADGKIDAADRQILGNYQPDWEGGMTNRFAYKNFDLSIVIYSRLGMKVLAPYYTADGTGNGFPFFNQSRVNQIKTNYWTRSNPTNDFPAPDAGTDRLPFGSTLGYYDGSFIKCRSINLGYEFSPEIFKNSGISSLRLYVNVTNPFIIYSPFVRDGYGIDPEGNGYGGSVNPTGTGDVSTPTRQISVNLNNPTLRQFLFGLNLKF